MLEDVVVRDVAGHAGLGQEALFGLGILAAGFGEDLDGHGAADDRVARAVDVRHASAQEFFELVLADSGGKLHCKGLSYQRRQCRPCGNGFAASAGCQECAGFIVHHFHGEVNGLGGDFGMGLFCQIVD